MVTCPHCGSVKLARRGMRSGRQRYECKNVKCGKLSTNYFVPRTSVSAKILLLDIETAPGEFYSWSREPKYLSPDMMIKDWSILCWSAKWLFEPEIMGQSVKPREAINRTEDSILEGIWKLMNEAQIIVTQNGNRFDIKRLNAKFIKHGYAPPSNYSSVDTLVTARERFDFTYNSLEELGRELLGLKEGKIKMNMSDWRMCVSGDRYHLDKMLTYCKNDVAPLLEDVYLRLRPWMKSHPNLNLYTDHDSDTCPKCESTDLRWSEEYATPQGLWIGFRCQSCGTIGRGKGKLSLIKAVTVI
jgi:uncharacterized Zn finger protein